MSMDEFLANFYGTTKTAADGGTPSSESLEKEAELQFFCKVAADQGIDLAKLSDAELEQRFAEFEAKIAESKRDAQQQAGDEEQTARARREFEEKRAEAAKTASAAREWEEKRASARDLAQSDLLGRTAAHAYVDELRKIAAAAEEQEKEKEKGGKKDDEEKDEERKKPHGSPFPPPKTASGLDSLAFKRAIEKVAAAGFDPNVATKRIEALYTLDRVTDSVKVARAETFESAIDIRALELLEQAGYPVEWAV
ncbi:hypothetical protein LVJ94_34875 [Pendulispora rubella]|uniref:Uncharacterized protein n=1 Tax=Pendulispora rubella TaxID=2741070 RepID=A0ABZ2KYL8_9BACT